MSDENLFELFFVGDEVKWMLALGVINPATTGWAALDVWEKIQGYVGYYAVKALEEMTKAERIALRDRVLGVAEFPAPVTGDTNSEQLSNLEETDDESEIRERI
jgi:hypothetical protein